VPRASARSASRAFSPASAIAARSPDERAEDAADASSPMELSEAVALARILSPARPAAARSPVSTAAAMSAPALPAAATEVDRLTDAETAPSPRRDARGEGEGSAIPTCGECWRRLPVSTCAKAWHVLSCDAALIPRRKLVTSVYLTEAQYDALKAIHCATGTPMAHVIREGIDLALARRAASVRVASSRGGSPHD
jgi:hypothetical protein